MSSRCVHVAFAKGLALGGWLGLCVTCQGTSGGATCGDLRRPPKIMGPRFVPTPRSIPRGLRICRFLADGRSVCCCCGWLRAVKARKGRCTPGRFLAPSCHPKGRRHCWKGPQLYCWSGRYFALGHCSLGRERWRWLGERENSSCTVSPSGQPENIPRRELSKLPTLQKWQDSKFF